jgi:energy-coupling factor transport system permease protein
LILLTLLVFAFPVAGLSAAAAAALLACFPLLKIRLGELRGIRILFITALVILLLQIFLNRQGPVLVQVGPLQFSGEGLLRGIYLGTRFLVMVLISYLFVLTTAPDQLAYALMQAGLPYRFGFTLVTALRLIPVFEGEALTVYRAQLVRGVSYKGKDWRGFWNNLQSYLLPLLVSAIQKVDALSISMEGRCYGMYRTRTYFRTREKYRGDWLAGLGLGLVLFAALYFKYWEG